MIAATRRLSLHTAVRRLGMALDWSLIDMVLIVKGLLLLFGVAAYETLADQRVGSLHGALEIWNRWDARHYLALAERGYNARGDDRILFVFFPLFPWLTRIVAALVRDYLVAALLVSGVASVIAAVLFARLVALDFSAELGRRAVWFLFIFPTSYFLHIGFTESLFLALLFGCLLSVRVGNWPVAGALGFLAALSRVNGALLVPVLAVEALLELRSGRRWQWRWLWSGAPALGVAVYLWINYDHTGNAFRFLELQREHWNHWETVWPWVGLRENYNAISWRPPAEAQMIGVQELLFTLLGLAATVWTCVALRPSYAVWMTGNWLLVTTNSFIYSVPRYALLLFPVFILFALLARRPAWNMAITVWSLLFLALFASLFVQGMWAF